SNMVCHGCGHNDFDIYSTIGTEDKFDLEIQYKLESADRKFKLKIETLQMFISEFPSLILNDPLARKIQKEIKSKTLPSIELKDLNCYRSRLVGGSNVFTSKDLEAPEIGISKIGRFNHPGQSVLYLAETKECSITEILENYNKPALIWTQEYKIGFIDNILDLTIDWDRFSRLDSVLFTAILNSSVLRKKMSKGESNWKPEYLLTNFVSDCAKEAGYEGIKYQSSRSSEKNLVIFDVKHSSIEVINKPQIFIHEPELESYENIFDI
ncbi:MAG: RES family NAD+ phosphorylase, partial [Candidatus Dojkabacteria bacterium]